MKTLTTLGDRVFVASAPKLWNNLPLEITMAKSVDTFKKILKTNLFSKAFHSSLGLLNTYTQLCNLYLFLAKLLKTYPLVRLFILS